MSARLPVNPFLLLVAASASWGVGTVLSKLALDRGIAPITLLAVEMGASSTVLLLALTSGARCRCSLGAAAHPRVGSGGRVPGRRPAFPRAMAGCRDRRACGPRRRADAERQRRRPQLFNARDAK